MNKHTVTIYGPGCARCEELYRTANQVANSLPGAYEVRKETDADRMAEAGVLATPALALDGQLLFSGKNPGPADLKRIITGELGMEDTAPAGSCCCGGGCCCGGDSAPAPGMQLWKKLVLWGVAGFVAVCGIRYMNKQQAQEDAPAAQAPAAAGSVQVVYYTFGARCPTCMRMEQWAGEAVEQELAQEVSAGRVSFSTRDADAATVQKYGLTTKTLMLHRAGTEEVLNLGRIWELSGDEAAFKAYVAGETRKFLSGHE